MFAIGYPEIVGDVVLQLAVQVAHVANKAPGSDKVKHIIYVHTIHEGVLNAPRHLLARNHRDRTARKMAADKEGNIYNKYRKLRTSRQNRAKYNQVSLRNKEAIKKERIQPQIWL